MSMSMCSSVSFALCAQVDESRLGGGTLSGSFSSACQTGSYYAMKVASTNMYLVVGACAQAVFIHKYT